MADATDPDPSRNPSSRPDRDRDWYAQQWSRLSDELGTSDPTEVLARVQALKREANQAESASDPSDVEEGLVTVSEVEEVFREMNQKMEKLRERNAALAERLEEEGDEMEEPFRDLHQKTEHLLDSLDAATMDEARERIQKLNQRLEALYREKEQLATAGLSDAEEALDELDRLREERDALRQERDRLQADRNRLEQKLRDAAEPDAASEPETSALQAAAVLRDRIGVSTPDQAEAFTRIIDQLYERVRARAKTDDAEVDDAPDDVVEKLHSISAHLDALPASTGDESLPDEVGDILGIRTADDARELESLIADMSGQLERLSREHEKLDEAGLSVDAALAMIENMEAQLADLYHGSETATNGTRTAPGSTGVDALDEALRYRITQLADVDLEAADDLTQVVRHLVDRLDRLTDEHDTLAEAGLDATEAVAMIESMEVQLDDLYRSREEQAEAAEQLAAIEDVLGISTREEAEELSQIARQMEEQLTVVYQEKEKLEALGLDSIEDAVDMIESMEEQLGELYEDKEALRDLREGGTEEQSTFQQLEALYAERERLQQALGVSSAEDVIELVESLNTQLDELYKGRDADVDPEERHDVLLWEPDTESEADAPTSDAPDREADTALTLNSMEHQLEALYREKETLLDHGLGSAQEAVSQLQIQQKQLDALQREKHTYEQRFDRLQSELGTASVSQIVSLVRTLASEADTSPDEVLDAPSEASEVPEYGLDLEAASPFVDEETLNRLDDLSPTELDALDVGAVRLSGDGTVEALNDAALQLPGLSSVEDRTAVVGKNFFLELAPSTNNNLFYGRFQQGQRQGALDARFPYTFTSPEEGPQSFAVHLYRTPEGEATWLLYRPT
jgi:photoactive yellow protein